MTERNPDAGQGDEPESALPADEEAAWAAIVAAYGDDPEDLPAHDGTPAHDDVSGAREEPDPPGPEEDAAGQQTGTPVRSFTVYPAGSGPRDWRPPRDGDDEDDEGHFVPPEPPPLPETDATTRFAWIAALGGPLLLFGAVLFGVYLHWWLVTLGVGGFLGGFATLVARMRDGRDDDFEDPGRGAVV